MTELIQLNLQPSASAIPAESGTRLLYLLAEITPGATHEHERTPMHCCMVVDWSPSMRVPMADEQTFRELVRQGLAREVMLDGLPVWQLDAGIPAELKQRVASPADWTIRAIGSAAERLGSDDRLSLVIFSSQARVLLRDHPGSEQAALANALNRLNYFDLGPETRIAGGLELALDLLRQRRVANRADRLMLLTDGFTLDAPACLQLADEAAALGVPISTIGLGIEFQEELLFALADRGGGSAAFITNPAEIAPLLDRELQHSQRTIARQLRLEFRLSEGVELRRLYRVRPALAELPCSLEARTGDLSLGDLHLRSSQALLFELLVPPHRPGTFRLMRTTLRAVDAAGLAQPALNQELVVDYRAGAAAEEHPALTELLARVNAYRLQTRALESAATGDVAGATRQLRAAVTRLIELGETDLANATSAEARRLDQTGQASAATTKQLRYATRRLTTDDRSGTGNGG